jgi:histone deacetylase 1/2
MEQPKGFEIKGLEHKVLRLHRSIYGLKQARRIWDNQLSDHLINHMGYTRSKKMFYKRTDDDGLSIIMVYVDDCVLVAQPSVIKEIKKFLTNRFQLRDMGKISEFIGIQIERSDLWMKLTQKHYIQKIIQDYDMTNAKRANVPAQKGMPTGACDTPNIDFPYREAIGSLTYLATRTRPDIARAVSAVAQFSENPTTEHVTMVKMIIRYLKGTPNHGITLHKDAKHPLYAIVDSNLAAPRSRTCYIIMRAGAGVIMRSIKQKVPSLSSTEAEYYAATSCAQKVLWARALLQELQWNDDKPTKIQIDNTSTIKMAECTTSHRRTMHIALRDQFLHFHVQGKEITPEYIMTSENTADIGTKA